MIKKSFVSRDVNLYVTLYRSFVRPVLEYCNIVWCPHQITLCDQIEAVQKRFTRLFPDMRNIPYRSRLTKLNMLSLRARRLRYKLIFLFKIVNNLTCLDPSQYFRFSHSKRHNSLKIVPLPSQRDCRRYCFFVDVVFHWNSMLDCEVLVQNVNEFKRSVTSYFRRVDVW